MNSKYISWNKLDWLQTTQREDPVIKARLQLRAENQELAQCGSASQGHRYQGPQQTVVTASTCVVDRFRNPALCTDKRGPELQTGKTRASKRRNLSERGLDREPKRKQSRVASAISGTVMTPRSHFEHMAQNEPQIIRPPTTPTCFMAAVSSSDSEKEKTILPRSSVGQGKKIYSDIFQHFQNDVLPGYPVLRKCQNIWKQPDSNWHKI